MAESKARKGDLAALAFRRGATYLQKAPGCNRGGIHEWEEWVLGRVVNATCDGRVKTILDARGVKYHTKTADGWTRSLMVKAEKLAPDRSPAIVDCVLAAVAEALGDEPIKTAAHIWQLIRPWCDDAGACVETWPNGLGWSLGGHNVVRESDGTATVALDLPGERTRVTEKMELKDDPSVEAIRDLVRVCFTQGTSEAKAEG